jgi:hypothetical protein
MLGEMLGIVDRHPRLFILRGAAPIGVVRWRHVNITAWIARVFGVTLHKVAKASCCIGSALRASLRARAIPRRTLWRKLQMTVPLDRLD